MNDLYRLLVLGLPVQSFAIGGADMISDAIFNEEEREEKARQQMISSLTTLVIIAGGAYLAWKVR